MVSRIAVCVAKLCKHGKAPNVLKSQHEPQLDGHACMTVYVCACAVAHQADTVLMAINLTPVQAQQVAGPAGSRPCYIAINWVHPGFCSSRDDQGHAGAQYIHRAH